MILRRKTAHHFLTKEQLKYLNQRFLWPYHYNHIVCEYTTKLPRMCSINLLVWYLDRTHAILNEVVSNLVVH